MQNNTCIFNHDKTCGALKVTSCSKLCKFAKTEKEYQQGLKDAQEKLAAKDLRAVVKNVAGDFIMSTEKIE